MGRRNSGSAFVSVGAGEHERDEFTECSSVSQSHPSDEAVDERPGDESAEDGSDECGEVGESDGGDGEVVWRG